MRVINLYKITAARHLEQCWQGLLYLVGYTIYMCYCYYNSRSAFEFGIILTPLLMLSLVPQIFLHINYYTTNKDDMLEYDFVAKEYTFSHSNTIIKFSAVDIEDVIVYQTYAKGGSGRQTFSWWDYSYTAVKLVNGTTIRLTSLLVGTDFEVVISEEKVIKKLTVFKMVDGPSLSIQAKVKTPDGEPSNVWSS